MITGFFKDKSAGPLLWEEDRREAQSARPEGLSGKLVPQKKNFAANWTSRGQLIWLSFSIPKRVLLKSVFGEP